MLFSYLKLALRNLYKYKLYSFINIMGLGVAIACGVVAYVNYQFSQSYDNFHENADRIANISSYKILNNNRINWSITPMPMGQAIRNDIPGVEGLTRISRSFGTLRYDEQVFNERFYFVEEDFFKIFDFELLYGEGEILKDKGAIVIDEELAGKYFGDRNPVGQQMTLSFDGEKQFDVFVRGVTRKAPKNSSLQFSALLPLERIAELRGVDLQDWESWASATMILTSENVSFDQIEEQLQSYKQLSNQANPDWQIEGFYLMPLRRLALDSRELRGDPFQSAMPASSIVGPSVVALLILLLACFNYVNTAIASSAPRLKEIGIRKVVGGVRKQLIVQFLGENLVLCMFALFLGLVLAEIFVPAYDSLWPMVTLKMNYSDDPGLLIFLVLLLGITAVAAGAYPAFYISRFKPVAILRGKQKLGGTNSLIRVLLTIQLALSMSGIILGLVFKNNAEYIRTADLGFAKEQVIIIPVNNDRTYTAMKNEIASHPDIVSIAGSQSQIALSVSRIEIEAGDIKSEVTLFRIGENYLETLKMQLVDGRALNVNQQTDIKQSVLVNETMMRELKWDSPADKYVKVKESDGVTEYAVVGVVADFKYNSVWRKVQPTMLSLVPPEDYRYLTVRFESQDLRGISNYLQETWKQLFPNLPYDGFFMDELQAEAIQVTESIKTISLYIAIISVLIAGMGLFALVSLNIAKRTKELGIRKVLGASVMSVGKLISREFVYLLIIATFLAAGFGYFMVNMLLDSIYAYYTNFGPAPFIISSLIVALVALLTVSSQVFRIATLNPVMALRDE